MIELNRGRARRKPRIGLAGFYGYGNFGDELFYHVFQQYLGDLFDLEVVYDQLKKPYFSDPVEARVSRFDAILIGGGDIVQPWGIDPRYFNRAYLNKPVFIAGVGVPIRAAANKQHVEKDWIVEKYRKFFSDSAVKFIHARDEESARWIKRKLRPAVDVGEAPDIVCALDMPVAKLPEGAPVLGVVTRYRPREEPDDYSNLRALCEHAISSGWRVRHIVLGTDEVGRRDFENSADLDVEEKELVYCEDLKELMIRVGECSALASMKFHGTVVATMYGVPSIVLVPTNKNRNFMRRIDLGEQLANIESERLVEVFQKLPEKLDAGAISRIRYEAADMMRRLKVSMLEHLG